MRVLKHKSIKIITRGPVYVISLRENGLNHNRNKFELKVGEKVIIDNKEVVIKGIESHLLNDELSEDVGLLVSEVKH